MSSHCISSSSSSSPSVENQARVPYPAPPFLPAAALYSTACTISSLTEHSSICYSAVSVALRLGIKTYFALVTATNSMAYHFSYPSAAIADGDGKVAYGGRGGNVEDVGVVVINGSVCMCWFCRRGNCPWYPCRRLVRSCRHELSHLCAR